MLGTKKKTKASKMVKNHSIHQVIISPVEEHSKKLDITRERIIQLIGDAPRIELFARNEYESWDCWGNEI